MRNDEPTSEHAVRPRYCAFISYAHADAKFATWLHRALEHFVIPTDLRARNGGKATFAPVFLDAAELVPNVDLTAALEMALADSRFLIVICSPAAAQSARVNSEIATFLRLHGPGRIAPVIIAGRPNAVPRGGSADEECFPEALLELPDPLAADARAKAGGRSNALSQLAAALLGVDLDTLRQRELQARNRRLAVIAAGTGAIALAMTSISIYAWSARRQALASEARATFEARSAQQVTDFLIELFSISNPSESAGNRVTAREILDRGAARLQLDLKDEPQLRARLERTIGTVYRQLGLYERAKPMLESALATSRADDVDAQTESLYQLALLNAETDQRDAASAQLQRGARLLARQPEKSADMLRFHRALAELRISQGQFGAARSQLEAATHLLAPGDSIARAELLEASARLRREQAKFPDAERDLKAALEIRERVQGKDHPDLAYSLYDLALLFQESGDLAAAFQHASRAIEITERVFGRGHPETQNSVQMVGILHAQQGRFAEALPYFERALDARIAALGPKHTNTGYSWYNLGHLHFDMGNLAKAREMFDRARLIWEESEGKNHPDVAYALDKEAEVLIRMGQLSSAEALLDRALAINRAAFDPEHPNVARTLINLARLRKAQARMKEARDFFEAAMRIRIAKFGADAEIVKLTRAEFAFD